MNTLRPPRPRDHHLLAQHRIAMIVAFGFLAGAIVIFIMMSGGSSRELIDDFDSAVRDAAQAIQWGPLTVLAVSLNVLGAWYVTWPLRIAVAIWLGLRRRTEALVVWLLAMAIYEPLVSLIKDAYARPRPPDAAVGTTGFSFPSGHATVGAAVAIGLVIVLFPAGPRRRYYEVLAGGFAFFMAVSRVYLDAHWMSDVVAGTALGAAVMIGSAATVHEVGDRLHWRRIRRDHAYQD
jgi:undecaprenyl-diphosphatase